MSGARPGRLAERLVRNTLFNFGGQAVLALLVLLATPYVVRGVGAERYGVLMLVSSFVSLLTLVQLGMNGGLVRYLAPIIRSDRRAEINGYVGSALAMFLALGAAAAALLALSGRWLVTEVFTVEPSLVGTAGLCIDLMAAAFFLRLVGDVYFAVPAAAQRFDLVNGLFVGGEAVRIAGSVLAIRAGWGIEGVCVAILFANAAYLVAGMAVARRLVPGIALGPSLAREPLLRLFHFSKYLSVSTICGRAAYTADKVMLGAMLPVQFVAYYDVPYGLAQKLWAVVYNVTSVVFPTVSELSHADARAELRALYLRSSRMVAFLILLPAAFLALFSREVLLHWIGPDFAREGAVVLTVVSVGFLLNCLAHVPATFAQAGGRPDVAMRFSVLNAAGTLALLALLVPRFGVVGAAAALAVTQAVLTPWFIVTANRQAGVRGAELLRSAFAPVAIAGALAVAAWLALHGLVTSLASLLAVGAAGAAVYLAVSAAIVLERDERAAGRALAGSLFERVLGPARAPATPAIARGERER